MDRQVLNLSREFLRLNVERAVSGPVYSDEFIEHQAGVYLANPTLRLLGVPFSYFLANPGAWLRYIGDPLRDAFRAHRAEAAIARAERTEGHGENGRLVEKTRHRAYPRRQGRDFLPTRDA